MKQAFAALVALDSMPMLAPTHTLN